MKIKKIIIYVLSMILCCNIGVVLATSENYYMTEEMFTEYWHREIAHSYHQLFLFGIVENSSQWQASDYLTRRDAFKMLYAVWTRGDEVLFGKNELPECSYFTDLEYDTYDFYLAESIRWSVPNGLLTGKITADGKVIADFDSNMTYYEALTAISRLFGHHWRYANDIRNEISETYPDEYPYFQFCNDIGLINSNNPINQSTLTIRTEDLNQKIPAWEFMHLLYQALYVPHLASSGYGDTIPGFRYIDYFVDAG